MKDQLGEYGVSVIALSKDTVEEAAIHQKRDGVEVLLLADPQLNVIRQYGVEHHKALGFKTGNFKIFGIALGFVPSYKTMAVPTSILIDESGVIRWIDQSEDYRLRSDPDKVMTAVKEAFGNRIQAVMRSLAIWLGLWPK